MQPRGMYSDYTFGVTAVRSYSRDKRVNGSMHEVYALAQMTS